MQKLPLELIYMIEDEIKKQREKEEEQQRYLSERKEEKDQDREIQAQYERDWWGFDDYQ